MGIVTFQGGWKGRDARLRRGREPKKVRERIQMLEVGKARVSSVVGSKRHSLQAVTVVSSCCANCVEPPRPQQWGSDLPFLGMPAMRTRWMAGAAAHKSG